MGNTGKIVCYALKLVAVCGLLPCTVLSATPQVPPGGFHTAPLLSATGQASLEEESLLQGVISGYCFNDANQNGIMDATEKGLPGVPVSLTRIFLLIFQIPVGNVETDAEGRYEFTDLGIGNYTIEAEAAEGGQCTSINPVRTWLGIFQKAFSYNFGLFPAQTPPLAALVHITAVPMKISAGESATLSWTSENAVSVAIDQGIGEVAPQGSLEVSPSKTTKYTISAEGEDGATAQASVIITVESETPPPPDDTTTVVSSSTTIPASGGGGSNTPTTSSTTSSIRGSDTDENNCLYCPGYELIGSSISLRLSSFFNCTEYYFQTDNKSQRQDELQQITSLYQNSSNYTWSDAPCSAPEGTLVGKFNSFLEQEYADKFLYEILYMEPVTYLELDCDDNKTNIIIPVSAKLSLTLWACHSCGAHWRIAEMDTAILKNTGHEVVSCAPPEIAGAPEKEIWEFTSQTAGLTALVLEYGHFQDWGFHTETVYDRFEMTVRVSEGDPFCGGIAEAQCPDGWYCFYDQAMCSTGAQGGVCRKKPELCLEVFEPVCGCDGHIYGNACEAARAGVSLADNDTCKDSGDL